MIEPSEQAMKAAEDAMRDIPVGLAEYDVLASVALVAAYPIIAAEIENRPKRDYLAEKIDDAELLVQTVRERNALTKVLASCRAENARLRKELTVVPPLAGRQA